jgi:choice-of-anchor B domain-containing protein
LKTNLWIAVMLLSSLISVRAQTVYDAQNITLLSRWFDPSVVSEPQFNLKYQSCWGYADTVNQREYAIIGSTAGTYIIDITIPTQPVERAYVPGRRDSCIWREYKTYKHYLYAVSDDGPPNSLQIIDLQYLPDSVHVVYDSDSLFVKSHTIYIDGNKLYGGTVSVLPATLHSMAVYSLNNPENPQFLASLNSFYPSIGIVHDMFVRNDTVYASCGFDKLHVFRFDSINNQFLQIGYLGNYPEAGYNHSTSLTADGKTLVMCDEVPAGLAVKVVDVSDVTDMSDGFVHLSVRRSGRHPHNPYVFHNFAVIAYYLDGVQIYDISNPANPVRTGYFDTHPQNGTDYSGQAYAGCWAAYPYLPSGVLIASDMQNGLFVLNANVALGKEKKSATKSDFQVFPNPSKGQISFKVPQTGLYQTELFDMTGKRVSSQSSLYTEGFQSISMEGLPVGMYYLRLQGNNAVRVAKVLKTE